MDVPGLGASFDRKELQMKKVTHKLSIQRETLVSLSSPGLAQAAGGSQYNDTVYRVPPKPFGGPIIIA
jgi:hypothetical protein